MATRKSLLDDADEDELIEKAVKLASEKLLPVIKGMEDEFDLRIKQIERFMQSNHFE